MIVNKIKTIKNTNTDNPGILTEKNNMISSFLGRILRKQEKSISFLCFFVLVTAVFFLFAPLVNAEESTVEQYAPILYFESEEQCYPIEIQYHLDNAELFIFNPNDGSSVLINDAPTSSELESITEENYYLDNAHGLVRDSTSIISHYQQEKDNYDITIYYRQLDQGSQTILQYWFFYAYNDGDLNVHEGDWEMIQLIIESGDVSTAMYSQHHSGQQLNWNEVEKTGSHPHVFVARGSHANYFRSFSGKLGIASDTVGNNGRILGPDTYELVELSDQGWLSFPGRWGETQSIEDTLLGFSGPHGPAFREEGVMWNNPLNWGERLPVVNTSLLPVEWLLYHFVAIFLVITGLSVALLLYKLFKRHKTHGLGPRFFSFLYIDGINRHSIANILFFVGIIIAIMGLLLPWYSVSASISGDGYDTQGFIDFLLIDGLQGVQISYPGAQGPIAVGSFILPFSILIGIGFVFTILKSIGVQQSNQLGKLFLRRGIGLIIPFVILVIVIFSLGSIIPSMVPDSMGQNEISTLFSSLSSSPFGGETAIQIAESGVSSSINMMWGLGSGGYLLLLAGAVLVIASFLHKMSQRTFFG